MKTFTFTTLTALSLALLNRVVEAKCDALLQINTCVQGATASRVQQCKENDYGCKCEAYKFIQACYQSCADDDEVKKMAEANNGLIANLCLSASLTEKPKEPSSTSTSASSTGSASSNPSQSGKPVTSGTPKSGSNSTTGATSDAIPNNFAPILFVASIAAIALSQ